MPDLISKAEVINIVYEAMNDLKKKVTNTVAEVGKLQSYVNDHKNLINAMQLAQAELLGTVEEMKTKLFDDDAGIITNYLRDVQERKTEKRAIWRGIILIVAGMLITNAVAIMMSFKIFAR